MTDHDSNVCSVTHGDTRLNTRVSHDNTKRRDSFEWPHTTTTTTTTTTEEAFDGDVMRRTRGFTRVLVLAR